MFVLCALFIQINWNEKYKPQDMFSILLPRRNTFEITVHIDGRLIGVTLNLMTQLKKFFTTSINLIRIISSVSEVEETRPVCSVDKVAIPSNSRSEGNSIQIQ